MRRFIIKLFSHVNDRSSIMVYMIVRADSLNAAVVDACKFFVDAVSSAGNYTISGYEINEFDERIGEVYEN